MTDASEATGRERLSPVWVSCPFCGEPDFDLRGLKGHLSTGGCATYEDTVSIYEWTEEEMATEQTRRALSAETLGERDDGE